MVVIVDVVAVGGGGVVIVQDWGKYTIFATYLDIQD